MPTQSWQSQIDHIHRTVVKAWKPYSQEDTRFLALALCGEVGELANIIKKHWRGDYPVEPLVLIEPELADIRIYLELLAKAFSVNLDEACEKKLPELYKRWPGARPR